MPTRPPSPIGGKRLVARSFRRIARKKTRTPHGVRVFLIGPSPLREDLAVHLLLFFIKPLDDQNHRVAHGEIGVVVLVGIIAHTYGPIHHVAEYAAAVLSGDHRLPPASNRVPLLRSLVGVGLRLLDGDFQPVRVRVVDLDDALQLLAGVVFVPQVGDGGIAKLPLGKVEVVAVGRCV